MELDDLTKILARKGVDRVRPACRTARLGGAMEVNLGAPLVGVYCAHCGHLCLLHRGTLEAPED